MNVLMFILGVIFTVIMAFLFFTYKSIFFITLAILVGCAIGICAGIAYISGGLN